MLQEILTSLQNDKDYLVLELGKAQESVSSQYKEQLDLWHGKIEQLKHEVDELTLSEDSFRDNNQKVLYIAGSS